MQTGKKKNTSSEENEGPGVPPPREKGLVGYLYHALRSFILWVGLVTFTLTMCLVLNLLLVFRSQKVYQALTRFWGRVMAISIGVQVEVEGLEKFYRDGPVIIVANHQSMLDIVCFYNFIPIHIVWMAKHTLFRIPLFGWAMYGIGCIPVVRDNRKKAMESLFDAAEQINRGKSVIIFPEGTRSKLDGTMQTFKKGTFVLAKKANVHLQPITIWGASRSIPIQKGRFLTRLYPGRVRVVIHDPVPPEEFADLSADELSIKMRTVIERPMDRLRAFSETLDE